MDLLPRMHAGADSANSPSGRPSPLPALSALPAQTGLDQEAAA
jgi:hypothetical protein